MANQSLWNNSVTRGVTAGGLKAMGGVLDLVGADRSAEGTYRQASNILDPNKGMNAGISLSNGLPMVDEFRGNGGLPSSNQPATPRPAGGNILLNGNKNQGQPLSGNANASAGGGQDEQLALAQLQQQEGMLRDFLARSQGKLGQGINQLEDDYGRERGRAEEGRERALRDFDAKTTDTTNDKTDALGRNNTNARTLANSVRQQIARASGSGSSAYQETAPGAVAREASIGREGIMEDFGTNFRNLDFAKKDAEEDYGNVLEDLLRQRQDKERGLREGIGEQEIDAQNSLRDIASKRNILGGGNAQSALAAGQPFSADISRRQQAMDSLFDKFRTPYQAKEVSLQNPTLRDYVTDRTQIADGGGEQDAYSPYSNFLKKPDEEKKPVLY